MSTYTEILNKVIRRLRKTTVSGPNDSEYALMVGEFINEAKRAVEDAWTWTALRETHVVNTVAGTATYAMTGAGNDWRLQEPTGSVYVPATDGVITVDNAKDVKRRAYQQTTQANPSMCYFEGVDASGDAQITFHQTPSGIQAINVDIVKNQADLSDGTDVLLVPMYPVVLGAYAKAIAERGEDSGRTHSEAVANAVAALSDAIAKDEAKTRGETNWFVA